MRSAIVVAGVAALVLGGWLYRETRRNQLVWDHFDVVKPGILYRSGQLNGDQLEAAIRALRLRTVISFQVPGAGVDAEGAIARRWGVDFVNLPMPGDGFGREEQFREVLRACDDPLRRPVLIHCARGTCRTGSAVALYRFERDGWTVADVAAEMRRQSYREGWLPGYVYHMVKSRPNAGLFEPPVRFDRNQPRADPGPPVESAARERQEATDVR